MDNYKLVHEFNPRGKTFYFRLSKGDCYRIKTGKCSITCEKSEKTFCFESDREYCQRLLESLIENGVTNQRSPVMIAKHSCGHYSIQDGQHRLCVAARGGICIDVYLQDDEYECYACGMAKRDLVYRCKALCNKNLDFLLRL